MKMKIKMNVVMYFTLLFLCVFVSVGIIFTGILFFSDVFDNSYNTVFPVNSSLITSNFGERINPISKKKEIHKGIDIASPVGSDVFSAFNGTVYETGSDDIYGNYVIIRHSDDMVTKYCHLDSVSVSKGNKITAGEKIGEAGDTGWATGSHLHFEVIKNGKNIDPMKLF